MERTLAREHQLQLSNGNSHHLWLTFQVAFGNTNRRLARQLFNSPVELAIGYSLVAASDFIGSSARL